MTSFDPRDRTSLLGMLDRYLSEFPSDSGKLTDISGFIRSFDGPDLADRRNPVGHLTASAMVVCPSAGSMLLLHHRFLDRYLQPGGHVEPGDRTLLDAAVREVAEETGLTPDTYRIVLTRCGSPVFHLDSHRIPASPAKGEGPHTHHDVRILIAVDQETDAVISDIESRAWRWFSLDALPEGFCSENLIRRIRSLV